MQPTTDIEDVKYGARLIGLFPSCFSGISYKELQTGFLFVNRDDEIVIHIKPERRRSVHGVDVGFGAMQLAHIASTKKGGAGEYMTKLLAWAACPFYLFVKTDNKRAIAFYKRYGFKIATEVNFKTFSSYIMVRPYV